MQDKHSNCQAHRPVHPTSKTHFCFKKRVVLENTLLKMNTSISVSHFDAEKFVDTISITSRPVPIPRAGEVLVRLLLRPVNPADAMCAQGHYPGFQPRHFPAVLGLEGVGVIEKIGEGIGAGIGTIEAFTDSAEGKTDWVKIGQRVVALNWGASHGNGTWQQYISIDRNALVPVPDDVPDHFAAAALINPCTALGMLESVNIPSGGTLLVTAAGSALNGLILKLATSRGIKVIGTVRRPEARDELIKAGFSEIVVTKEGEGLAEAVKKATDGKGANAALDSIIGPIFPHVVQSVADGGKVLAYGAQSGSVELKFTLVDAAFRAVTVAGFWVNLYLQGKSPEDARAVLAEALKLNQQGIFATDPGEELPLEKAAEAITKQFTVARGSKIFLKG